MKKDQDKPNKKKKQIDWEERLFQVASQFLANNNGTNSQELFF